MQVQTAVLLWKQNSNVLYCKQKMFLRAAYFHTAFLTISCVGQKGLQHPDNMAISVKCCCSPQLFANSIASYLAREQQGNSNYWVIMSSQSLKHCICHCYKQPPCTALQKNYWLKIPEIQRKDILYQKACPIGGHCYQKSNFTLSKLLLGAIKCIESPWAGPASTDTAHVGIQTVTMQELQEGREGCCAERWILHIRDPWESLASLQ